MRNKVVTIMERSMRELGLRTVRFNFRCAGESEGEHDDGYGETDDLFAVAEWVRCTRPDDSLWLGGFSFGSYVALRAALNLDIGQLISIAPPVDRYTFDGLRHPECPWLVIQGDEDEVVNIDLVRHWVGSLKPPPELVVMREADHFFHRRLMDLRGLLKNGVRDQLPEPADASLDTKSERPITDLLLYYLGQRRSLWTLMSVRDVETCFTEIRRQDYLARSQHP